MRLIVDAPADGPVNMARDEALLEGAGGGTGPTLRLYRWNPPTVSLGYFQRYAEFEQLAPPAGDLEVVRRTTGGGAILHDCEWTYALALPAGDARCSPDPRGLYERVHTAFIDAVGLLGVKAQTCGVTDGGGAQRGPFFCFERRHCLDVVVGALKLAGSAQRRTRGAVLQHGSLMVDSRFTQHRVAALRALIDVPFEDLLEPLIEALGRRLQERLEPGAWSGAELARSAELREKYASRAWTCKF